MSFCLFFHKICELLKYRGGDLLERLPNFQNISLDCWCHEKKVCRCSIDNLVVLLGHSSEYCLDFEAINPELQGCGVSWERSLGLPCLPGLAVIHYIAQFTRSMKQNRLWSLNFNKSFTIKTIILIIILDSAPTCSLAKKFEELLLKTTHVIKFWPISGSLYTWDYKIVLLYITVATKRHGKL